ncbi:long-chain-fatty-acid--CoA ligase [Nocardia brasiliensis]
MTARSELLFDRVRAWAADRPDEIAMIFRDRSFTWAQWVARIDGVVRGLVAAGIRPGDRVAFLDKNNPACLEVLFAAASLGAVTVVVNWRLADDELAHVLSDSAARLLFVGSEFVPAVQRLRRDMIEMPATVVVGPADDEYADDQYEAFRTATAYAPFAVVHDTLDCLIIYSSGTTGRPKGVVLSHRALVAHTVHAGAVFPFTAGDRNLVAMPLFHVVGVCYALFGLYAGVPTIMLREPDVAALAAAIDAGATHTFLVPPVVAALLMAEPRVRDTVGRLSCLGYGAAPMPPTLVHRALAAWPGVDFVQVYGQTELSGVVVALRPADHRDKNRPGLLRTVGTVVSGVEVRVAEIGTGRTVDNGAVGELWFRTDQRMTGYLGRPDATAEAITSDGWLHTGDIGHIDADGYVSVDDRLKDMIITGGENVYGPEVERVLIDHPAVLDVAVIGVPDDFWGESVKAVVVLRESVAESELVAFCRTRLAGYKCPRTIDFVPELPRNASGKVLKRQIRQHYWHDSDRVI